MAEAVLKAKISLNDSLFTSGMKRVAATASSVGKSIGHRMAGFITSPMTAAAGAIAGLFSAALFEKGIQGALEAGSSLEEMSKRTGMAVGALSVLQDQFKFAGVDADVLAASVNKMQRSLVNTEGKGNIGAQFARMGLDLNEVKRLAPEQQFTVIGRAISNIASPAGKAAAAMAIFGRGGAQLLPVFDNLKNVDAGVLNEKARLLEANASSFHETTVALKMAGMSFGNMWLGMTAQMAPAIKGAADQIRKMDWAGIGKKIGDTLSSAMNFLGGIDFGAYYQMLGAGAESFWEGAKAAGMQAINSVTSGAITGIDFLVGIVKDPINGLGSIGSIMLAGIAGVADLLFDSIKYPCDWLANFFDALGKDSIPTIGDTLYSSLGLAALNFEKILIGAGLDLLTVMSEIPGLVGASNSAISGLMKEQSRNELGQGIYRGRLASDDKKIGAAADSANAKTKWGGDVYGAGFYAKQALETAQNAAISGSEVTGLGNVKSPFDQKKIQDSIQAALKNAGIAEAMAKKFADSFFKSWKGKDANRPGADEKTRAAAKNMALGEEENAAVLPGGLSNPSRSLQGATIPSMEGMNQFGSGLSRIAHDKTPLLSLRERNKFENQRVAGYDPTTGMRNERQASTPYAYGATRHDDAKRQRKYDQAQERLRLGQASDNAALNSINSKFDQLLSN